MDARAFLEGLGFLTQYAIDFLVGEDGGGFDTVDDLVSFLVQESDLIGTNLSLCKRRRLWTAIHEERIKAQHTANDANTTSTTPLKGIIVQIESKSSSVCNIVRSNIAELVITEEFSKNLVTLLTAPPVTNINGMVLKGPPFKAVVVQSTDSCVTKACVEVAEATDKAPFLVVRVLGRHEDGTVSAQLPSDFLHTTPYDHEKISIDVKHIGNTTPSSLATLKAVPNLCPALHQIQLQLLGGTNKALPKIPGDVTARCIEAIRKAITLNEGDALFGQSEEFMRALRTVDFNHNVHQGMLLWGPAGGAKTTLARLLGAFGFVTAFDGNLVSLGTEFQNSSSKGMRNLFEFCTHYNHLPFLLLCDEIDRVVQKRDIASSSSSSKKGGGNESENTLSLFLEQLTSKKNVFVIGTTNKYHAIDSAAIRAGRLGLHVFVGRLSPKSAQQFIARILRSRGYKTAASNVQCMTEDSREFQQFSLSIFNQTGASLEHAINAIITLGDLPATATWDVIQPALTQRIDSLRNPAIDPSAIRLQPDKMHLTLTGPINALTRAISRNATTPDNLPILQSVLIINSASGEGFAPGNGHQLHLPFRIIRKHYPSEPLPEPGHFPDVLGAVVSGIHADFLEIVNQSNLPEQDDIAAFAHEKIKMGGAGLVVVGINVDSIIGVKEDRSVATCKGTNEGSETNASMQKSDTRTASESHSRGKDTGYGTNKSYNSGTTSGWNQGSGGGTQIGLMWDTDSTSFQEGTHSDVTVGSSHGFDKHASWNESVSNDKSRAVGITMTEGSSISTGSSEQRTVTVTQAFEDNAILRRLTTLIETLQHAQNVVVAVISSREDMFTMRSIVHALHIKPPMQCALCNNHLHDPSRLLHGHTAVPCCTYCFKHAPHNAGMAFDDGQSSGNVEAALRELTPVLPLVEEIECCSVEGHWASQNSPPTIQQALLRASSRFPNLQRVTLCAFGDALPIVSGGVSVTRRPPEILNRPENLHPHCESFGRPCIPFEGSTAHSAPQEPDVHPSIIAPSPASPSQTTTPVNAPYVTVNTAPGAPPKEYSVGACLNALLPLVATRIQLMVLRIGVLDSLHQLLQDGPSAPPTTLNDIYKAIRSTVDVVNIPCVLANLLMRIPDVKNDFEVRRIDESGANITEYCLIFAQPKGANQTAPHSISNLLESQFSLQATSQYLCLGFQRFTQEPEGEGHHRQPLWNEEIHYTDSLSVPLSSSSSSSASIQYRLKCVISQSAPTDVCVFNSPQQGITWRLVDKHGMDVACSATDYKRQRTTVVALIYERIA